MSLAKTTHPMPLKRAWSWAEMFAVIRLCAKLAPDIAIISPLRYSLLTIFESGGALRSKAMYSSENLLGDSMMA